MRLLGAASLVQIDATVVFQVDTLPALDVIRDLANVVGKVLDHVHQNAHAGLTKALNIVDGFCIGPEPDFFFGKRSQTLSQTGQGFFDEPVPVIIEDCTAMGALMLWIPSFYMVE